MKKFLLKSLLAASVFAACAVALAFSAFAAPESLSSDVASTVYDVVTVKAPPSALTSTNKKALPISGAANDGVVVTIYKHNGESYIRLTDEYGGVLEITVGASGLFALQTELTDGANQFLVYAQTQSGEYQVCRFEVNLLREGFMDKIYNLALSLGGFVK